MHAGDSSPGKYKRTNEGRGDRRFERTMAMCPICESLVDENNPTTQGHYQDETYYFCSVEHQSEFEDEHIQ